MTSDLPDCQVRELIRERCNDDCPDWGTCPLAAMIMKAVINLFESYKPRIREEPE